MSLCARFVVPGLVFTETGHAQWPLGSVEKWYDDVFSEGENFGWKRTLPTSIKLQRKKKFNTLPETNSKYPWTSLEDELFFGIRDPNSLFCRGYLVRFRVRVFSWIVQSSQWWTIFVWEMFSIPFHCPRGENLKYLEVFFVVFLSAWNIASDKTTFQGFSQNCVARIGIRCELKSDAIAFI